jgi:hypothetical protein
MEGQFNFWLEVELELELIEVDFYGICGFFDHCFSPVCLFERKGK